ncbi:MAG TPA: hypothetical protein VI793_11075 [Anaerolineales bacterium]|nr:hypothetical protein [Anaerolineales bacterium]
MKTPNTSTHPLLLALRWAARLSSIVFIGVFILMFIGEGFEPAKITPREWASLFFFPFGLVVGMILAWWKEGLGGAMTVVSVFASLFVSDPSSSGGGYMLICASPGFLFLLYWILSKSARMPAETLAHEEGMAQPFASSPLSKEVLEARKARVAAGRCPKCDSQIASTAKNCPACRINLVFARGHLDQW